MTQVSERRAASTEDESADPVGDGSADADFARKQAHQRIPAQRASHPGRDPVPPDERDPPVEPDRQDDSPDDDGRGDDERALRSV